MDDQELRDRFEEWAEPLRATPAPAVTALRGRIRRRMARMAAATGSALAVVGLVAGLLVAGGLAKSGKPNGPQNGQTGSGRYFTPPGQPYVFVNNSSSFANQGNLATKPTPAELRNAATGKVVEVLRPVGRGASFTTVAVAPDDRLFVLAQQDSDATLSFAEIRISASGKPGPLRLVQQIGHACVTIGICVPSLSLPAGTVLENMTVNATGTRLAVLAATQNGNSGSLVVYNLQTGALIGRWPASKGIGSSQFLGSGDELVASVAGVTQGRNRLIDTSKRFRRGSSLLADSRPDKAEGYPGYFTQDGNTWLQGSSGQLPNGQPTGTVYLQEFSAASNKPLWKIPIGPSSDTNGPYFCGMIWASANGNEVLAQCGRKQLEIVGGHVSKVRLAWLLPTDAGSGTFAW